MKIKTFIIILLISSSLLLLPLLRSETEVQLFPFQKKSVIINLQSTKIKVTSNRFTNGTRLNVSLMDPVDNKLKPVIQEIFVKSIEFEIDQRGNYLFEFLLGLSIATITIDEIGLPQTSFIYILGLLIVSILYFLKRTIFPTIDV